MNKRATITLYHVQNMDWLMNLAGKSHGPVCIMDGSEEICDLRADEPAARVLHAIGREAEIPEVQLSIPSEDLPMYLDSMISQAA